MWLNNVVRDVIDERTCAENGGIALPLYTRPAIALLDEPEGN